jgi:arylsulfatase A-like enzyme
MLAGSAPAPPGARNVVLIVWDTVRAYNLNLYGYPRNTTPNIVKWARKGVVFESATAPAPWTFPSHSSFFTGQWPFRLNSQWKFVLNTPDTTLAEYLARCGYQTAGFAANTNCCSYETGLARGFAHFEDYALSPRSILSRTVPGNWILKNVVSFGDFYDKKWIGLQSRGAREINDAFLDWLGRRRPDHPFFAFLNCFDADEPYIPPPRYVGRFGVRPETARDYQLLLNFVGIDKNILSIRDI